MITDYILKRLKRLEKQLCCLRNNFSTPTQEFASNEDALNAGLEPGDSYYLPYDGANYTIATVRAANLPVLPSFTFTANKQDNKDVMFQIKDLPLTVDWGDGLVEENPSVIDGVYEHTYTDFGTYEVTVIGELTSVIQLSLGGTLTQDTGGFPNYFSPLNEIISITDLDQFTSLEVLELSFNKITSFDYDLPASLEFLGLRTNLITEFNPTNPLPSGLQRIDLQDNELTDFTLTHSLPNTLNHLFLGFNELTTFDYPLPLSLTNLELQNNQIDVNGVNEALINIDSLGFSSPFNLMIPQIPSAPPSGDGITAKNNLIGRGATITTD